MCITPELALDALFLDRAHSALSLRTYLLLRDCWALHLFSGNLTFFLSPLLALTEEDSSLGEIHIHHRPHCILLICIIPIIPITVYYSTLWLLIYNTEGTRSLGIS